MPKQAKSSKLTPKGSHEAKSQMKQKAFSLVEVLIAIGILGIGLAMAAALFPAAIQQNASSFDSTIGTIICENGLAIVKARNYATPPFSTGNLQNAASSILSDADRQYAASNTLGFLVLGRQVQANDYQLVVVAYQKRNSANTIQSAATAGTVTANTTTFADTSGNARLGSPIVDPASGKYALITGVSGNNVILDRPIDESNDVTNPWVITESSINDTSPAMAVMVTRTALSE